MLGAIWRAITLMDHCAKMLLGPWPEDFWSGISFSQIFWGHLIWEAFIFWEHLFRGRKGCQASKIDMSLRLEKLSLARTVPDKV